MRFEELRDRYPEFRYDSFTIEETDDLFRVSYCFEIPGLSRFCLDFTVAKPADAAPIRFSDYRLIQETVFSLGMVEAVSYWKLTCAPHVTVAAGHLDDWQIQWWKKLYFNGLGEFFFQNGIHTDMNSFMTLSSTGSVLSGREYDLSVTGNLIPVGGGKDSFVSLDLLSGMKEDNHAFVINSIASAVNSAHAAGYCDDRLITPHRTLDAAMLELNKKGYLNGHTPFSAMVSFASYLTALIYRKRYIVLSNESSANESTVKESTVNHQYSKSFEYESDFRTYCNRILSPEISYFSLLRPINELQIAFLFSSLKQYHKIFRSCNVGQKTNSWCGHCAKCLFVYVMLSAFLKQEELIDIFGRDMLNDPEMTDLFEQLTGIQDNKPFECVGTREEVNLAVCLAIASQAENGIPLLYRRYQTSRYYAYYRDKRFDKHAWNEEHMVPEPYRELIIRKLEDVYDRYQSVEK